MENHRNALFEECRKMLIEKKSDYLAKFRSYDSTLAAEISGDEGDIASTLGAQDVAVTRRENILVELKEIEEALSRLEEGTYGICEETEEPIEEKRLLAIPWTRLSLAGALIREKEQRERRVA